MVTATSSPKTTRRSKGEQTRNQILNAAIITLAKQGIKGTTHRAVAQQAELQLSLTTYYFKDIKELVHSAFALNSEHIISRVEDAWPQAFAYIEQYGRDVLTTSEVKKKLCMQLSQLATQYIYNKLVEDPIALAVEQLMFTEVQHSTELRTLAQHHRAILQKPLETLAAYFTNKNPQLNADLTLTLFMQLEYRHLGIPTEQIDINYLQAAIRRQIGWLMGIKQF